MLAVVQRDHLMFPRRSSSVEEVGRIASVRMGTAVVLELGWDAFGERDPLCVVERRWAACLG